MVLSDMDSKNHMVDANVKPNPWPGPNEMVTETEFELGD